MAISARDKDQAAKAPGTAGDGIILILAALAIVVSVLGVMAAGWAMTL